MQVTLDAKEATVLREVITRYLGDLRMEIGKTEDHDLRAELHERERALAEILSRLG